MLRRLPRLMLIGTLVLAGCEDDGPNISGGRGYEINSITVLPEVDTIFVPDTLRPGDRALFQAVASMKGGTQQTGLDYVWSTSDPSIATVDETGVVTPRSYGTVEIRASAYRIGTATLVILPATNAIGAR